MNLENVGQLTQLVGQVTQTIMSNPEMSNMIQAAASGTALQKANFDHEFKLYPLEFGTDLQKKIRVDGKKQSVSIPADTTPGSVLDLLVGGKQLRVLCSISDQGAWDASRKKIILTQSVTLLEAFTTVSVTFRGESFVVRSENGVNIGTLDLHPIGMHGFAVNFLLKTPRDRDEAMGLLSELQANGEDGEHAMEAYTLPLLSTE